MLEIGDRGGIEALDLGGVIGEKRSSSPSQTSLSRSSSSSVRGLPPVIADASVILLLGGGWCRTYDGAVTLATVSFDIAIEPQRIDDLTRYQEDELRIDRQLRTSLYDLAISCL